MKDWQDVQFCVVRLELRGDGAQVFIYVFIVIIVALYILFLNWNEPGQQDESNVDALFITNTFPKIWREVDFLHELEQRCDRDGFATWF